MRSRSAIILSALAIALSACTQAQPTGPNLATAPGGAREVLFLDTGSGVMAVDPSTGRSLFARRDVVASPGWNELFSATSDGAGTRVDALDATTGSATSSQRVKGDLALAAVSPTGSQIALMPAPAAGTRPWTPVARASTPILVANASGSGRPLRFNLDGNYAPEAFSADGSDLFMIQYLPATAPTSYRVSELDLDRGKVYPVFGRTKGPVETMSGTRLQQVPDPRGTQLYTLYSNQPPDYAKGYSAGQAESSRPVAFIHTLSLESGWAVCVDLPRAFGPGPAGAKAIAVSPGGGRLYAIDTERGLVSVMNTKRLRVSRTGNVDFGEVGSGPTSARVSADGSTLYVGVSAGVVTIDTATLSVRRLWPMAGVTGLGLSADGRLLYVAMSDEVAVIDAATGRQIRMIPAAGVQAIEAVARIGA